jgi:hypothetical protein
MEHHLVRYLIERVSGVTAMGTVVACCREIRVCPVGSIVRNLTVEGVQNAECTIQMECIRGVRQ